MEPKAGSESRAGKNPPRRGLRRPPGPQPGGKRPPGFGDKSDKETGRPGVRTREAGTDSSQTHGSGRFLRKTNSRTNQTAGRTTHQQARSYNRNRRGVVNVHGSGNKTRPRASHANHQEARTSRNRRPTKAIPRPPRTRTGRIRRNPTPRTLRPGKASPGGSGCTDTDRRHGIRAVPTRRDRKAGARSSGRPTRAAAPAVHDRPTSDGGSTRRHEDSRGTTQGMHRKATEGNLAR